MTARLSFKSRNTGRIKKAGFHIRLGRMLRRKRVSFAHTDALQSLRQAQKHIDHLQHLAKRYNVPLDQIPELPSLPLLPSREWVECLQAMGELREPVIARQPEPARA